MATPPAPPHVRRFKKFIPEQGDLIIESTRVPYTKRKTTEARLLKCLGDLPVKFSWAYKHPLLTKGAIVWADDFAPSNFEAVLSRMALKLATSPWREIPGLEHASLRWPAGKSKCFKHFVQVREGEDPHTLLASIPPEPFILNKRMTRNKGVIRVETCGRDRRKIIDILQTRTRSPPAETPKDQASKRKARKKSKRDRPTPPVRPDSPDVVSRPRSWRDAAAGVPRKQATETPEAREPDHSPADAILDELKVWWLLEGRNHFRTSWSLTPADERQQKLHSLETLGLLHAATSLFGDGAPGSARDCPDFMDISVPAQPDDQDPLDTQVRKEVPPEEQGTPARPNRRPAFLTPAQAPSKIPLTPSGSKRKATHGRSPSSALTTPENVQVKVPRTPATKTRRGSLPSPPPVRGALPSKDRGIIFLGFEEDWEREMRGAISSPAPLEERGERGLAPSQETNTTDTVSQHEMTDQDEDIPADDQGLGEEPANGSTSPISLQ